MQLQIPIVGITIGPEYANDVNNSLNLVDSHDHTFGKGVPITTNALNINADLTLNTFNLISTNTVRFVQRTSTIPNVAPNQGCIYIANGDFYVNDALGHNPIQITSGGAVNATTSGISNPPASATFISSQLVVNSNVTTPANIVMASAILGNLIPSTNTYTVSPPTLGANYVVTMPLPPTPNGTTAALIMDWTGAITASVPQYQAFVPTGVVFPFSGGSSIPAGFLLADGSAVSRSLYPNLNTLYSGLGYPYGSGDGLNTFNVPNLTDRAPFGIGSRFTLGQTGGNLDPSLDTLVSHGHGNAAHSHTDAGHQHFLQFYGGGGASNIPLAQNGGGPVAGGFNTNSGAANIQPNTIGIQSTGNSSTNGNMPPFIGMNYIIKT